MNRKREEDWNILFQEFCDAISGLSIANKRTGLWDHVRFEECKKPIEQIDCGRLYLSEKRSRMNVEERAVQRTKIDQLLTAMLQKKAHP